MKESDVDRFEAFMNENVKTQEKSFLENFDQKVLPDCILIGKFVIAYKHGRIVQSSSDTLIVQPREDKYLRLTVNGVGVNTLIIDEVFPIYPTKTEFVSIREIDGILNHTRAVEFVNPDCRVGQVWNMPNALGTRMIVSDRSISPIRNEP